MDEWLIQRARATATGANVHRVNGLCQWLVFSSALGRDGDAAATGEADRIRRVLHALVRTGRFPRHVELGFPLDGRA